MIRTVHQKVPARNGRKPNFPSIGRQLLSVSRSHRWYWLNIGSDLMNITCLAILSFASLMKSTLPVLWRFPPPSACTDILARLNSPHSTTCMFFRVTLGFICLHDDVGKRLIFYAERRRKSDAPFECLKEITDNISLRCLIVLLSIIYVFFIVIFWVQKVLWFLQVGNITWGVKRLLYRE